MKIFLITFSLLLSLNAIDNQKGSETPKYGIVTYNKTDIKKTNPLLPVKNTKVNFKESLKQKTDQYNLSK